MNAMTTLNTTTSVSDRQAAALRAGLVLLSRVGDTAAFYLTFDAPTYDTAPTLNALIADRTPRDKRSAAATDTARLTDLRFVAIALDTPLNDVRDYDDGVTVSIAVRLVIDGVDVRVWTPLTDPVTISFARALVLVPTVVPTGATA